MSVRQDAAGGDRAEFAEAVKRRQDNCREVAALADDMSAQYTGDPQAIYIREIGAEARYCVAHGFEMAGDVAAAIQIHLWLLDHAPTDYVAASSKAALAELYWRKERAAAEDDDYEGDIDHGPKVVWLKRIIDENADLEEWPALAHYDLGVYYRGYKRMDKAKRHMRDIVEKYPKSSWADAARANLREWEDE